MRDEVSLLFREVADLQPAERARYFEQHEVSPEVRAEVESLLQFDSSDAQIIQLIAITAEEVLESRDKAGVGFRCGPYRLMRLLGRGGAGEVFLAERVDGQVEQQVAIKLLLQRDPLRQSFQSRFLQERQILASLQHPGIARLLDAGETPDGRLYLVLDYIDGAPIDKYSAALDLESKLRLFLKVCEAVAYAHRNLIIHRDLKPSNILVSSDGEPKLLDFGIAKILDAATEHTRTQERLLTPEYASPEQFRGAVQSTATDIYSLGAVLYEMLTGHLPTADTELVPARRLNRELPGDLEFILAKALRKEPEERYSSVEAMADDVRAFLEWRPVRARSGNAWYRTRKFLRRYRVVVAAAMLTIAGLSLGFYIANRQRIIAQERFRQVHLLSTKVFDLDNKFKQLPGATEARHEIVSMSLEYLERLGNSAQGDLDLAQEIGAAYQQVGRIQGVPTDSNLGDAANAEKNLEKADRFIDLVLASRKHDSTALLLSARIAQDRMILAQSQGRTAQVKVHAARAVERLWQLLSLGKPTPEQLGTAASCYLNIALAYTNVHMQEAARLYARKAMETASSLPSERRIRAGALSLIGNSLRSDGRLEEGLEAIREARKIAEARVYLNPVERAMDLYGILLREARTLGQDGVSLGRPEEAIPVYREAMDLMEELSAKDPRDQNARDRLATCARELADVLDERDPQQSLVVFDLAIQRLREIRNNPRERRREAQALAESSYPLRRLHRFPEARRRIDAAFVLLRETGDFPAKQIKPDSEVVAVLRAQADYESETGDRKAAVEIYERLLSAMMATNPDASGDLQDATKISTMYYYMAIAYRHVGEAAKAGDKDERRVKLWRQWDSKLPGNAFVQRQLTMRSE